MNYPARRLGNEFGCTLTLLTLIRDIRVLDFLLLQNHVCVQHFGFCYTRQVGDGGYVKDSQRALNRQWIDLRNRFKLSP